MADESTETVETPSLDMEAASDQIGASLFPETPEPETPDPVEQVTEALVATPEKATTTVPVDGSAASDPSLPAAPKSWPKEMHAHWGSVPKPVQEYWQTREKQMLDGLEQYKGAAQYGKAMQDVVTPYQAMMQAQGIEAPHAVRTLLEAHSRLTTGTIESRQAAYDELGRNLRLPPRAAVPGTTDTATTPLDPRIQTLESQLQQIQSAMTAREQAEQRRAQAELNVAREKAGAEVNAFATATNKDGTPINAFFDEVHEDIIRFIPGAASLQEAYDKAVWANPVTREKQKLSYFQTESEKQRERARLDALPKQKARGVNVNGRDTQRTPTEPLGSMEDTLRDTLKGMKERTVH